MSKSIRDKYIQYRTNPDNDDKSDSHFCTSHEISLDELREMQKTDNRLSRDILQARRETYSQRMSKIDNALFRSAEQGD